MDGAPTWAHTLLSKITTLEQRIDQLTLTSIEPAAPTYPNSPTLEATALLKSDPNLPKQLHNLMWIS